MFLMFIVFDVDFKRSFLIRVFGTMGRLRHGRSNPGELVELALCLGIACRWGDSTNKSGSCLLIRSGGVSWCSFQNELLDVGLGRQGFCSVDIADVIM